MAFREIYRRQVALLIRILPLIPPEDCFALKGGTAINLFIRDMPRLSVDIDVNYVGADDVDKAVLARARHADAPRIAADLAVLDEAAGHLGLDVDLDLLAAIGTGDKKLVIHVTQASDAAYSS